jgi:hypothetical protein
MLTDQIVALLIAERDKLNRAIEALSGPTKRRGRPPKKDVYNDPTMPDWVKPATPKKKARKKRIFSAEEREAARQRMKAMWEKRRKAAKPAAKKTAKPKTKKTA